MHKFIVLIAAISLFTGCCQNSKKSTDNSINKDSLTSVLLAEDRKWNDLAQKKGFYHARLDFVADNSIEMGDNSMPLEGKKAIEDYTKANTDLDFTVSWKPIRAEVAASGELGYSFGGWTLKTKTKAGKDTTLYGNYITVWHKQADGSWKYIIDGGGNTPKPVDQ